MVLVHIFKVTTSTAMKSGLKAMNDPREHRPNFSYNLYRDEKRTESVKLTAAVVCFIGRLQPLPR